MEASILNLINKLHFVSSKLHMFHWNVTGRDFLSYHEFFEESYKELLEQKDQLAEYLRFSEKRPIINFAKINELANGFEMPNTAEGMLEITLKDYKSLLQEYENLVQEPILEAIVSDILKEIEKKIYFIQSILN